MRTRLIIALLMGLAVTAAVGWTDGSGPTTRPAAAQAADLEARRAAWLIADSEIVRKNMFRPALPEVVDTPPPPQQPAQVAPEPPTVTNPTPPDAVKPEDFQFITGIIRSPGEAEVLVEDRRTRSTNFLKVGDPLGEGVITSIGLYGITVKEWERNRDIELGYSVSGKKDTLVVGPITPAMAMANTGGRRQFEPTTPEQRQELMRRRDEQVRQQQQQEAERQRQEAQRRQQEAERERQRQEALQRLQAEMRARGGGRFTRGGRSQPS
jgi:hypothetical protein